MATLQENLNSVTSSILTSAQTFLNDQLSNVAAANGATLNSAVVPQPASAAGYAGANVLGKITPAMILFGVAGFVIYFKFVKKGRV